MSRTFHGAQVFNHYPRFDNIVEVGEASNIPSVRSRVPKRVWLPEDRLDAVEGLVKGDDFSKGPVLVRRPERLGHSGLTLNVRHFRSRAFRPAIQFPGMPRQEAVRLEVIGRRLSIYDQQLAPMPLEAILSGIDREGVSSEIAALRFSAKQTEAPSGNRWDATSGPRDQELLLKRGEDWIVPRQNTDAQIRAAVGMMTVGHLALGRLQPFDPNESW